MGNRMTPINVSGMCEFLETPSIDETRHSDTSSSVHVETPLTGLHGYDKSDCAEEDHTGRPREAWPIFTIFAA